MPSPRVKADHGSLAFPNIRLVKSAAYANLPNLKAKVSFMTEIETSDDEVLVRSMHPSLKHCREVSVIEAGQLARPLWLVNASEAHYIESTHAAGREIHIFPKHLSQPFCSPGVPVRDIDVMLINPRAFLTPQVISLIREAFPGSSGIQVTLTGWVLVIFPDKKSLVACWAKGVPNDVGSLRVGYILTSSFATATVVESGHAVTDNPANMTSHGALGLRLRLPGGLEAITTVTHAFVRLANPSMSNLRKGFTNQFLLAKGFLQRLRPPPRNTQDAAIVHVRTAKNSPIGKAVWLSGAKAQVCTEYRLTKSYLFPRLE